VSRFNILVALLQSGTLSILRHGIAVDVQGELIRCEADVREDNGFVVLRGEDGVERVWPLDRTGRPKLTEPYYVLL
jgi:hypothetical protein